MKILDYISLIFHGSEESNVIALVLKWLSKLKILAQTLTYSQTVLFPRSFLHSRLWSEMRKYIPGFFPEAINRDVQRKAESRNLFLPHQKSCPHPRKEADL